MNYPKIFVINLKSSIDRKKHMKKVLSELPITFELIEAVDAKNLTNKEITQYYNDEKCRKNIGNSIAKTEIAVAFSQIKVWRNIQQQNLESAFIMEDDIIVKDKIAFLEILKKQKEFPKDWELILFAHGSSRVFGKGNESSFFYRKKIFNHYEIIRFTEKAWGALGYLINKKGVKKLLQAAFPIQGPIDDYYTGNDKIINLYGIEPIIIEEHPVFGQKSNIEKTRFSHRKNKKVSKKDLMITQLKNILEFLYLFKIAKQILRLKRSFCLRKYT